MGTQHVARLQGEVASRDRDGEHSVVQLGLCCFRLLRGALCGPVSLLSLFSLLDLAGFQSLRRVLFSLGVLQDKDLFSVFADPNMLDT